MKNFNSATNAVSFTCHSLTYASHVLDAIAAGRAESFRLVRQFVQGVSS
jgi:hypothetical protein